MLFEPDLSALEELCFSSTESVLTVQPGGKVLILFHNHQNSCINVKEQIVVGAVHTIKANKITLLFDKEVCQSDEGNDDLVGPGQGDGDVNVVHSDADRRDHLKKVLSLPREGMSKSQLKELERFLIDSNDVFSLHEDDLGCTSLVQHRVDTGGHAPIKQPPRRFAILSERDVTSLIDDMTKRGIIQPSVSAWASPILLVPK